MGNETGFTPPDPSNFTKQSSPELTSPGAGKPASGKISEIIGEGKSALNSIAFVTLVTTFFVALVLSAWLLVEAPLKDCTMASSQWLELMKGVWGIFIPILTLVLGYVFGKSKN
jgi:hypothetical protein